MIGVVMEHCEEVNPRTRVLLLAVRQGLIIILGALEDYLQLQRSIMPKHRREE